MSDSYRVLKKIGAGTFGTAFLARRRGTTELVVVKKIELPPTPEERSAARREAHLLSHLRHPCVVKHLETYEEDGHVCIVTEYCEGGDLAAFIEARRGGGPPGPATLLPEREVLRIFTQLCLALFYLHKRKILHRDIKLANVFLCGSGGSGGGGNGELDIRLGDLGVAACLKNTMDQAKTVVGTPYFLSPEICESRPYNHKSDIWAAGCVLYELCAQRHAFEAGSITGLVRKILRGRFDPLPPGYSPELRALIEAMLQMKPGSRPGVGQILLLPLLQPALAAFTSRLEAQGIALPFIEALQTAQASAGLAGYAALLPRNDGGGSGSAARQPVATASSRPSSAAAPPPASRGSSRDSRGSSDSDSRGGTPAAASSARVVVPLAAVYAGGVVAAASAAPPLHAGPPPQPLLRAPRGEPVRALPVEAVAGSRVAAGGGHASAAAVAAAGARARRPLPPPLPAAGAPLPQPPAAAAAPYTPGRAVLLSSQQQQQSHMASYAYAPSAAGQPYPFPPSMAAAAGGGGVVPSRPSSARGGGGVVAASGPASAPPLQPSRSSRSEGGVVAPVVPVYAAASPPVRPMMVAVQAAQPATAASAAHASRGAGGSSRSSAGDSPSAASAPPPTPAPLTREVILQPWRVAPTPAEPAPGQQPLKVRRPAVSGGASQDPDAETVSRHSHSHNEAPALASPTAATTPAADVPAPAPRYKLPLLNDPAFKAPVVAVLAASGGSDNGVATSAGGRRSEGKGCDSEDEEEDDAGGGGGKGLEGTLMHAADSLLPHGLPLPAYKTLRSGASTILATAAAAAAAAAAVEAAMPPPPPSRKTSPLAGVQALGKTLVVPGSQHVKAGVGKVSLPAAAAAAVKGSSSPASPSSSSSQPPPPLPPSEDSAGSATAAPPCPPAPALAAPATEDPSAHSLLGGPSPPAFPSSPSPLPPTAAPDPPAYRVEALRIYLAEIMGDDLFFDVYRLIVDAECDGPAPPPSFPSAAVVSAAPTPLRRVGIIRGVLADAARPELLPLFYQLIKLEDEVFAN